MINANGWCDWTIKRPIPNDPSTGKPWKINAGVNSAMLFLPHSAVGEDFEGWWRGIQGGIYFPTQFWINKKESDGVIQLYPIFSQCWASGSAYPNNNGIAAENQGGRTVNGAFVPGITNEPQTDFQVAACARILKDITDFKRRDIAYWTRPANSVDQSATLYEHRECKRFGSAATACPSDRIRWKDILRLLGTYGDSGEEDDNDMQIVSKAKTGDSDFFRSFLNRGRVFEHIPDKATFDALAKLNLPLYEPDKTAWDFMTQDATIIGI